MFVLVKLLYQNIIGKDVWLFYIVIVIDSGDSILDLSWGGIWYNIYYNTSLGYICRDLVIRVQNFAKTVF
mgnify:CR=1 FL=1